MTNQGKGNTFITLITVLLWGVLAVALKIATKVVDSPTIVWFRFITGILWNVYPGWPLKIPKDCRFCISQAGWLLFRRWHWHGITIGYMFGNSIYKPQQRTGCHSVWPDIYWQLPQLFSFTKKMSRLQFFGFLLSIAGFWIFLQSAS